MGGIFLLFNNFCYLQEFNNEISRLTKMQKHEGISFLHLFLMSYPLLANAGLVFILKVWKFILKLEKYISKLSK